ncbi:capping protein inhibiting regulator of actin dynamics isoform X2 [Clupea harengus]|uniref:Capping protein inhibiting regulator of actin dynamics isoform X2 n=1 Tax=Clupea harengus TaxID=7950 RepID=A0A6P8G390_CLUHA|nr:capping protein inhibiting regulator of actin dynamics isoform X2 [Clupea harengus]
MLSAPEQSHLSYRGFLTERRRQGKFQPFRRLFGKKKKREGPSEKGFDESKLKPSHSVGDVCNGVVSDDEEANQHLSEVNPLGSRALSHDSIFIPEDSAEKPSAEHSMSQENVSDKVRSLQRQIAQGIKFGQKPPSRKSEGDEGSSDEEEVPGSPLKVMAQVETEPADVETKAAAHGTPGKSPRSKRVLPPEGTIESINLDAVPQSGPRLDNAAAKHKLSVKPKNQRVSRKHRRFTQELQDVDLPGLLQEETDAQGAAEESGGPPEHSKKQRLQEDEQDQLKHRLKREHEEGRQREEERKKAEELRLVEERHLMLEEERRQREEEERRKREQEERMKREEEERVRRELEEKRRKEEEERQERKMREEEERKRREDERKREEEERRRHEGERLRLEEEKKIREAEEAVRKEKEAEKRRLRELEEKQRREEEERLREEERKQLAEEEERMKEEEEEEKNRQQEERERASVAGEEWKRKAEEMRWKEMEERQPFTFKVSSGEKQILFQKVNLTPVTPGSGQQAASSSETGEGAKASSSAGADSPTRSSIYVPHTAILVTGAQLCGTAVNLDQIKDTACKSLLGLGAPTKTKTSPDRKSGKTKSLNLSAAPSDQSSAAVLAEWASIRSKIFKGVEEGKYEDNQEPTQSRKENQSRPTSEDLNQSPFPHPNLRKTLSASAKFSITPARKKFGDSNRNSEILCQDERDDRSVESVSPEPFRPGPSPPSSSSKTQTRVTKSVRISDNSEECMFAKDLPSFLVPSPNQGSPIPQTPDTDFSSQADSEGSDTREEGDQRDFGGDEQPSPFGIKLRRTNYSLRFHNDQSTEKRKKRYSAGDCFDGVPGPLTPMDPESDSSVFSERSSPTSPLRENVGIKPATSPSVDPQMKPSRSPVPSVRSESERFISKPPVYQKLTTALKPSDGAPPPSSLLIKVGRTPPSGDTGDQQKGSQHFLSDDERSTGKDDEASTSTLSPRISPVEEETKEKKSFFPSISIPWREKTDRKTELIKKEKPSLQSRHSLDSSKVQEKEAAGPLWITLALQKQKGFREQQLTREERKTQREAKLAEKQCRESVVVSPTGSKGNRNTGPPKPQTPEDGKRPESLLGRFERRENLKKANTLPSSVTVEIADSTPSPPAVKEVSKRFPPGDSQQVSTEPAWLALAKRKAKAWSDCPQIIK